KFHHQGKKLFKNTLQMPVMRSSLCQADAQQKRKGNYCNNVAAGHGRNGIHKQSRKKFQEKFRQGQLRSIEITHGIAEQGNLQALRRIEELYAYNAQYHGDSRSKYKKQQRTDPDPMNLLMMPQTRYPYGNGCEDQGNHDHLEQGNKDTAQQARHIQNTLTKGFIHPDPGQQETNTYSQGCRQQNFGIK